MTNSVISDFAIDKKISDTWKNTGSQNIDFLNNDEYLTDKLLLNNNIKGLFEIDNYPPTNFLNIKNYHQLSFFEKKEKFKTYKKISFNNKLFSSTYIKNYRNFLKIKKYLKPRCRILEIGAGIGILSSMLHRYCQAKIVIVDIPHTLLLQEIYLKKNFNNKRITVIKNCYDELDFEADFLLVNNTEIDRLKIKFDLVINIDSFAEMNKFHVDNYINKSSSNLRYNGIFFSCNSLGRSEKAYKSPCDYPIPKNLKILDIDVRLESSNDTNSRYFDLILIKKNNHKRINPKKIFNLYFKKFELLKEDNNLKKKLINFINDGKDLKKNILYLRLINNYLKKKNSDILEILAHRKDRERERDEKVYYENYNSDRLYLRIFNLTKYLFSNYNKNLKNQYIKFIKTNLKVIKNDFPNYIKTLILLKFVDKKTFNLSIYQNKSKFFEFNFFKFALLSKKNINYSILSDLIKKNNKDFFNLLKLCLLTYKFNLKKTNIFAKILFFKDKLYLEYFLKFLLYVGDINSFLKNYDLHKKKINDRNIINYVNLTCYPSREMNKKLFSLIANNKNFKFDYYKPDDKDLNIIIFLFKISKISELQFINLIKKYYFNNFYKLGHILRCTLNQLKKENIKLIVKKSLKLRNSYTNINFLADIYFYNFMYREFIEILNFSNLKLSSLSKFKKSIFFYLKRIKKINNNLIVKNVYFQIFNSGYTSLLPFLHPGGNSVYLSGFVKFRR